LVSRLIAELHRVEILRRAAALRRQYPDAPIHFLARSLEYETGLTPSEIEDVLRRAIGG